jgi:hypothetical protein
MVDQIDVVPYGPTVRLRALGMCMRLLMNIDYDNGYVATESGNLPAGDLYSFLGIGKRTAKRYLNIFLIADVAKVIDGFIMVNPSWYWCEKQVEFKKKYMWGVA